MFVTTTGGHDRGRVRGYAWTEAGAWRRARKWRAKRPTFRQHYACGNLLADGTCADKACDLSGWFEVRHRADANRSLFDLLDEEVARGEG